jgi:23S rRNA pseudouridine1911/1915/1917 synthase
MHEPTEPGGLAETLESDEGAALEEPEQRVALIPAILHGQRLDKALVALVPEFSRSHLQALVTTGQVRIDGQVFRPSSRKVAAGQHLDITLVPGAESRAFRPEPLPIDVVHEDAHLMVVNKRAGWVVHPAAGNWSGTLLNALLAHHRGAAALPRAGIVHRLDKDTSGLLIVAKTLAAMTGLTRAIAARTVRREYQAIAQGEVESPAFSIEAPIGRDPRVRVRMAVVTHGKPARTDVRRVAVKSGFSALVCALHTGRTHQIRVHLASRGHALVGDALYGGQAALGLKRQALHAARLVFEHPVSGDTVAIDIAPPEDFLSAWNRILA